MVPRGIVADIGPIELLLPVLVLMAVGPLVWAGISTRIAIRSFGGPAGWRAYLVPTALSVIAFWLPRSPDPPVRIVIGFVVAVAAVLVQRFVLDRAGRLAG